MNSAELDALCDARLSHEARSLYLLYLRPRAERGQRALYVNEAASYLCTQSPIFPCAAGPAEAEAVLGELAARGLIRRDSGPDGPGVTLPYFEAQQNTLPGVPFAMTADWRPGPTLKDAALIAGVRDLNFTEGDLSAFVNYWRGRREMRTQFQWEASFLERLKKRHELRTTRKTRPSGAEAALGRLAQKR